jgi:hypothetical protein
LTSLNLGGNRLRGTIPGDALSALSKLQTLTLGTNYITGTLPSELSVLPLVNLGVDTVSLSGTIPLQFSNLTALTYLGLRCSGLCGTVPLQQDGLSLGFHKKSCKDGTCYLVDEFFPSCDCKLFMTSGFDWYCVDKSSPWGALLIVTAIMFGISVLYPLWRWLTKEKGLAAFSAAARRAGCTSLSTFIASRTQQHRAVEHFMAGVAAQASKHELATAATFRAVHHAELEIDPAMLAGRFQCATHRTSTGETIRVGLVACAELRAAELQRLSGFRHPNVLEPAGVVLGRDLAVLPDLSACLGSLADYVTAPGRRIPYATSLKLGAEVATGVAYLHMAGVGTVHGSVCAANALVFRDADSGDLSVRLAGGGLTAFTQQLGWQWHAPELLSHESAPPTWEADVYALGTTLWETFHGSRSSPLPGLSDSTAEQRCAAIVGGQRPAVKASLPNELKMLIASCLLLQPDARITAAELACKLTKLQLSQAVKSDAPAQNAAPETPRAGDAAVALSSVVVDPIIPLPDCPKLGLSLAGLRAFVSFNEGKTFDASPEEQEEWHQAAINTPSLTGPSLALFESLTTAQVVQRVIKPLTVSSQGSYVDMLQGADVRGDDGRPLVALANVFISHAWKSNFMDLVAAITSKLGGKCDSEEVYLWNGAYSLRATP